MTTFTEFCTYTLRPQYTAANIRSGPGTSYPVKDTWERGEEKLVGEPPVRSGGWRKMYEGRWVTEKYIIRVGGGCVS